MCSVQHHSSTRLHVTQTADREASLRTRTQPAPATAHCRSTFHPSFSSIFRHAVRPRQMRRAHRDKHRPRCRILQQPVQRRRPLRIPVHHQPLVLLRILRRQLVVLHLRRSSRRRRSPTPPPGRSSRRCSCPVSVSSSCSICTCSSCGTSASRVHLLAHRLEAFHRLLARLRLPPAASCRSRWPGR